MSSGSPLPPNVDEVLRRTDCPNCMGQRTFGLENCTVCHGTGHAPADPDVEGLLERKLNLCPPDDVEMHAQSPHKPLVDLIRDFANTLRAVAAERDTSGVRLAHALASERRAVALYEAARTELTLARRRAPEEKR